MFLLSILKEAQNQTKFEAEDIEKLTDSNSDIKGRLSEVVRENAKEMLDPERKVNGQPVPLQQPNLFTGGVMRWYQVEGIEWLRVSRQQDIDKLSKHNGNRHGWVCRFLQQMCHCMCSLSWLLLFIFHQALLLHVLVHLACRDLYCH